MTKMIIFLFLILNSSILVANIPKIETNNLIEDEKNTIAIFDQTVKSVVNVSNIRIARSLWDFEAIEVPSGAGTGWVWDEKGHIVTNYHVIQGGRKFLISFHGDKKQYEAEVVGVEPAKDVAVLKLIKKPNKLHPIKIGNSTSLKVGQKTVAIGNPFGLDHTITQGIVSAVGRKINGIGGVSITGMIQTDASINPGNSGGPLLNSSGQIIGMNTMIFSRSGSSAGVGFAVPIDSIKRIIPQIIKYGEVKRPGLGIQLLTDNEKEYFGIPHGLVIKKVIPNSPAEKAGLEGMNRDNRGRYYLGDIIISVDNKKVDSFDDIFQVLDKFKIGDSVSVTYKRGNKVNTTTVKLYEVSRD